MDRKHDVQKETREEPPAAVAHRGRVLVPRARADTLRLMQDLDVDRPVGIREQEDLAEIVVTDLPPRWGVLLDEHAQQFLYVPVVWKAGVSGRERGADVRKMVSARVKAAMKLPSDQSDDKSE